MKNLLLLVLVCASLSAQAEHKRSFKAKSLFKHSQPCPSTGRNKGAHPGYIIDHHIGLCVGGSGTPEKMRWMTTINVKLKSRWECKDGWQEKLV